MTAKAPFTAFYSPKLRDILPCLSAQETKLFVALATYMNDLGTCWPGVRELAAITTFPPEVVSDLLQSLQAKKLIIFLRQSERDPLTGKMRADVYAINPEIALVSNTAAWDENLNRHSSIPESDFSVKSAQADRFTEAETGNQKQRSRFTAPEGAASLPKFDQPHALGELIDLYTLPFSAAGNAKASNSAAQRQTHPPSSAAPPSHEMTFAELSVANAIRRDVPDISSETVRKLIKTYGVEQVAAAVGSYKKRSAKHHIAKPTGWIIRNLESSNKSRGGFRP